MHVESAVVGRHLRKPEFVKVERHVAYALVEITYTGTKEHRRSAARRAGHETGTR